MQSSNVPLRLAHLHQSLRVRWANLGDVPSSLLLHAPQIREPSGVIRSKSFLIQIL